MKTDVKPFENSIEFAQDFLDDARRALIDGEYLLAENLLYSAEHYFRTGKYPMPGEIEELRMKTYEMGLIANGETAADSNGVNREIALVRAKEYGQKLEALKRRSAATGPRNQTASQLQGNTSSPG